MSMRNYDITYKEWNTTNSKIHKQYLEQYPIIVVDTAKELELYVSNTIVHVLLKKPEFKESKGLYWLNYDAAKAYCCVISYDHPTAKQVLNDFKTNIIK